MYTNMFNSRLKIRHLIIALNVAEAGSTTGAADRLMITQPAVTRAIRELESILGVQLFERTNAGMSPTAFADVFLDRARSSLVQSESAIEEVKALARGEFGIVKVGIHVAGTNLLLPKAISTLKEAHPQITVVVETDTPGNLYRRLARNDLDLVVSRLASNKETIELGGTILAIRELFEEPFSVVTAENSYLARSGPLTLGKLENEQWILPVRDTSLRQELEAVFQLANIPMPTKTVECTSPTTVQSLLRQGGFVGTLPFSIAATLPDLKILDVVDCRLVNRSGILWPRDRVLMPAATLLKGYLENAAEEIGSLMEQLIRELGIAEC